MLKEDEMNERADGDSWGYAGAFKGYHSWHAQ